MLFQPVDRRLDAVGASILSEQPLELGLGPAFAPFTWIDAAVALPRLKSLFQLLAHLLGAVAFQRQLDQFAVSAPAVPARFVQSRVSERRFATSLAANRVGLAVVSCRPDPCILPHRAG